MRLKSFSDNKIKSITIFIQTYNHEKYIGDCIKSINSQITKHKIQLIIFDDASTDNTEQKIKEFNQKNIKYIKNKKNLFSTVKGNYLLFLLKKYKVKINTDYWSIIEGDDFYINKFKIEKQVNFLESHKNYAGCSSNFKTLVGDKYENHFSNLKNYDYNFLLSNLEKLNFYSHLSTWVWRKKTFENNQILPECLRYKNHKGDVMMNFQLIRLSKSKIYNFNDFFSVYRVHNKGYWNRLSDEEKKQKNDNLYKTLNKYKKNELKKRYSIKLLLTYIYKVKHKIINMIKYEN